MTINRLKGFSILELEGGALLALTNDMTESGGDTNAASVMSLHRGFRPTYLANVAPNVFNLNDSIVDVVSLGGSLVPTAEKLPPGSYPPSQEITRTDPTEICRPDTDSLECFALRQGVGGAVPAEPIPGADPTPTPTPAHPTPTPLPTPTPSYPEPTPTPPEGGNVKNPEPLILDCTSSNPDYPDCMYD